MPNDPFVRSIRQPGKPQRIGIINKAAFEGQLRGLGKGLDWKTRREMIRKVLKPFVEKSQRNLKKSKTGDLKSSIGTMTFKNNQRYVFAGWKKKSRVKTGASTGPKTRAVDSFYAKFIEFGFTHIAWPEKGKRIKYGDYRRSRLTVIPGQFFIERAFNSDSPQWFPRLIKRINDYIDKKLRAS